MRCRFLQLFCVRLLLSEEKSVLDVTYLIGQRCFKGRLTAQLPVLMIYSKSFYQLLKPECKWSSSTQRNSWSVYMATFLKQTQIEKDWSCSCGEHWKVDKTIFNVLLLMLLTLPTTANLIHSRAPELQNSVLHLEMELIQCTIWVQGCIHTIMTLMSFSN